MSQRSKSEYSKVAAASLVGSAIEWYDFFLYGTMAAIVFPKIFFPTIDPSIGVIAAFATYAVGFLARPLGGIVFGHFGDRIGRKSMLMLSLVVMGLSTFLMGLLPTYGSVGMWAAVMLTVLRLLQGFAVGGEWGAAVVMVVEHAPSKKRGLFGSFPQMGVPVGLLLSTGIFVATSAMMPDTAFFEWGWRIPFLLSITLVIIGMYIRYKLTESPVFEGLKEKNDLSKNPAIELVRDHKTPLLLTIGMKLFQNALFYITTAWVLSYIVNNLKMPRSVGLNAVLLASALGMITLPLFGYLSDKIGRKPVYAFGAVFGTAFVFPYFWMLDTHSVWMITLATVIALNIANDAMYGPQAVYFSELFGTKVRLSGANIGYAVGAVLSGGLAPLIAAALVVANDGKVWGVGLYLIALGVISTVCALIARETYNDALE